GYLLTEKLPEVVNLHQFVNALEGHTPADRRHQLRRILDQIACLIRDLHRRQLSHRDLKAANILVDRKKAVDGEAASSPSTAHRPPSTAAVWLIDLVGVSLHHRLRRSRRVQNLARLHASFHHNPTLTRTDKLRFLRTYLQWGLFGRAGWKRWWRDIEAAT